MPRGKRPVVEHRKDSSGSESAFIAGSQLRVSEVARLFPQYLNELIAERMATSLPNLTSDHVLAAIEYWREHPGEIEAELREEGDVPEDTSEPLDLLTMSAFAEDWESEEDAIYDDILNNAGSQ